MSESGDLWVFAYGSLMWRPGFRFVEALPARLSGYHRAFCLRSTLYRGTPTRPGLVLGLAPGGSCAGRAFRVAAGRRAKTMAYLARREIPEDVYRPTWVGVRLADGKRVRALTYVANRAHVDFEGDLSPARTAARIAHSAGRTGTNRDYLRNTVRHLDAMGIADGPLHRLLVLVEKKRAGG